MEFNGIQLKPKKTAAGQSRQTSAKDNEESDRARHFRKKRITVIAVVASILLMLTISIFAWQSSIAPPNNEQQPKLETPKAAILDGIFSESPNLVLSQSLT